MGLPDLPEELTDWVAFLLQLALARAQRMGEAALAEVGLAGREYGVLAMLEHGAPAAQHQVGAALGMDRTTTMSVLAGLESRGLVDRSRNPADRRAYLLTVTELGQQLRARAAAVLTECDARFLESLPAEERERLRGTLRQLLR